MTPLSSFPVGAMSPERAADFLGCGRTMIYDLINPEKVAKLGLPLLPSVKLGKRRLIRAETAHEYLAALESRSAA